MSKPLIVHVLYSLATGGMERVVLNVINQTREHYRHAVICLTQAGALRDALADPSIPCIELHKRPGKDLRCYLRLWRTLRDLRPDLVQTCNLGALDASLIARLADVRTVVHAEHGRDISDPQGSNPKYRRMRRWLQPCIARFVPVSQDLANWLRDDIGIRPGKITCIRNGIDTARYAAAIATRATRPLTGSFAPPGTCLIGTVARLDAVKDHAGLIEAFALLCATDTEAASKLRLALVGEGAERTHLEHRIVQHGLGERVRLFGNRADVPALLAEFDVFVLSSIAEGIPLTVLEAMAAGLPVVSTRVGGVGEVVDDGTTGTLVPPSDPAALAAALRRYVDDATLRRQHGDAGHELAESRFGMAPMVASYVDLFDGLLSGKGRTRNAAAGAQLVRHGDR